MNVSSLSKRSLRLVITAIALGFLATAFLDVYNYVQHLLFNKPLTRYEFIGRWVIYMTDGVFSHVSIKAALPRTGELLLGWVGHYSIGVGFALLMLLFTGIKWIEKPTFMPALIVGFATCSIPYFIMYPAMGYGVAGILTTNPTNMQVKVLISHLVFAIGLYLSGWLVHTIYAHYTNKKHFTFE